MVKKAFITGITGQDGSYLTELLISKGYQVHGILRRSSVFTTERIDKFLDNESLHLYHGDLNDSSSLHRLLDKIEPDEIYNLGAQSHVAVSFEVPEYTADVTGIGTIRLLDAIRDNGLKTRFYQASTSELFGGLAETAPQDENTPFHPKSPYGAAKLYSYWVTVNYRESYNIHASNGILFNHESPRRGRTFVTRKITQAVAEIHFGKRDYVELGYIDSYRDWGHAKDYAEGMWRMLQQETSDDYVLATGETHSVREFVEKAFEVIGKRIIWQGSGVEEVGLCADSKKILVKINPRYFRPAEVEILHGNPLKAEKVLGWKSKITFSELVEEMVESDLQIFIS